MATPSPGPRRNSSGLVRDVEILELLGGEDVGEGGLGVRRVAELTGRDKAVVSRTLATLADAGLVDRDPATRRYRLGSRLFVLAARTAEAALVRRARAHLREVARVTGETTHLCVLRGGAVVTLASEVGHQPGRTSPWEGVSTAAWRTPSGRVLLSGWDGATLEAWWAEHGDPAPLPRARWRRIGPEGGLLVRSPRGAGAPVHDLATLRAELRRVCEAGYAVSRSELEPGVVAASAPVRSFTGEVVAALNVSAPETRSRRSPHRLGEFLRVSAVELSRQLGDQP